MKQCTVNGCLSQVLARGMCSVHYDRMRRTGRTSISMRAKGTGTVTESGHILLLINGRNVFAHRLKAEQALGRSLPRGAVVHHANGDPSENRNNNLVICPGSAYHQLLHLRLAAWLVCGDPNWRICKYCHQYDAPEKLAFDIRRKDGGLNNKTYHRACRNQEYANGQ